MEAQATVLVAEDDHDVLALVAAHLTRDGYAVITARDGKQTLDLARAEMPALVVLDVKMPRLTGYEVVEALRADEKTKHIRIILLTGSVREADLDEGFDVGADAYIRKPFESEELRSRVRTVLAEASPET